ncbi:MAG: poly-beta-hydroxybutyrate polymerase, partial [Pseudomonadota bacterium]
SVFKIHLFADADVTFILTNGGHNAGVVNEPGHPHRHHFAMTKPDAEPYIAPDEWLKRAQRLEGSWWPTWAAWLEGLSGAPVSPPEIRRADADGDNLDVAGPLPPAPGRYVLESD